jgi:hypothetical protein
MKIELTSTGCDPGCRKLRILSCHCEITGWYDNRGPRDGDKNTPKEHEMKGHGGVIKWWWDIVRMAAYMHEEYDCMCFNKARCYRNAFNDYFMEHAVWACRAENLEFDCRVYTAGTAKEEACAMARTARNEANRRYELWVRSSLACEHEGD